MHKISDPSSDFFPGSSRRRFRESLKLACRRFATSTFQLGIAPRFSLFGKRGKEGLIHCAVMFTQRGENHGPSGNTYGTCLECYRTFDSPVSDHCSRSTPGSHNLPPYRCGRLGTLPYLPSTQLVATAAVVPNRHNSRVYLAEEFTALAGSGVAAD